MFKNLFPGMIGIHNLPPQDAIAMAQRMNFGGVDVNIIEMKKLAESKGIDYCRSLFEGSGLRAANWIMPNDWKKSEEEWRGLIADMPRFAEISRALGCTRSSTYFGSASNDRDYQENLQWHAMRLRPLTAILAAYDIDFGMEFMGPRNLRRGKRYTFVHNVSTQMELADRIGTGNVGLLLDAWHLYTSGDTPDILDTIDPKAVVNVHIADAPVGLSMDEYVDDDRRVPLETGVIDLAALLRKLDALGYDGPITPEPFSKRLNAIAAENPAAAADEIADVMNRLWQQAGLAAPKPVTGRAVRH